MPDSVVRRFASPAMSKTQIVFPVHAGEIWTDPREGGEARRSRHRSSATTAGPYSPGRFPAGVHRAWSDGNADVYVVPATGGEPRRLTYHPGGDWVVDWSPDGTKILFSSERDTPRDLAKLFTVSVRGGPADELPLPSAGFGASYSPDGTHLAYVPYDQWQSEWKKYRGGQTTPVWIADLADSHVTKIPRDNSNDRTPMWVGDTVYFTSDRNGPRTLFAYDVKGGAVREIVHNPDGFDVKGASAGPGGIIYDQLDQVRIYDFASGRSHRVPISVTADFPEVRPHFEHVDRSDLLNVALSPTGKRVLFEAHGEILSTSPRKATCETSPAAPTSPIAIRPGPPTGSGSRGCPTSPASTRSTSARRTGWAPKRRSTSARRGPSSIRRRGRPTARRSSSGTSA